MQINHTNLTLDPVHHFVANVYVNQNILEKIGLLVYKAKNKSIQNPVSKFNLQEIKQSVTPVVSETRVRSNLILPFKIW